QPLLSTITPPPSCTLFPYTTLFRSFLKAGYSVHFVPIDAAPRRGSSKIRRGSDGGKFVLIVLKLITIFSPMRIFVPVSLATFTVDRKSTRLNSSHVAISYAVFCLKK